MISATEHIKIGYKVEYVFDVVDTAPFTLIEKPVKDVYYVLTNLGNVTATADTRIQLSNGTWVCVENLRRYKHTLKHNNGVAVVSDVIRLSDPILFTMYRVEDTDYVNVNGFYISADV